MNRYALWKYLVIAIAVLLGTVYTLPNFFGEAPAVQVSPGRSSVKVDLDTQGKVEDALKVAGLTPTLISLENNSLRVRFDTTDQQLKAKDAIQRTLNVDAESPSFIVALNLETTEEDLMHTVFPHPTLSETLFFAAEMAEGSITDLYVPKK
jgi:preprotein translocase subunit SecD